LNREPVQFLIQPGTGTQQKEKKYKNKELFQIYKTYLNKKAFNFKLFCGFFKAKGRPFLKAGMRFYF